MLKAIISIFLSSFFFSTMEVALKMVSTELEPLQITFIRFLIGGLVLLPFGINYIEKNSVKLNKKDYAYMFLLGIICVPVSMIFFQLGVENSNASTAAVIFCANPLFTILFAHFITDEKMKRRTVLALLLGMVGILFMVEPWNMGEGNTIKGFFCILAAALTFGLYSVLGKRSIGKIGSFPQISISFLFGTFVLMCINFVTDTSMIKGIDPVNLPVILYIGIGVTGLGYLFYFIAMEKSDATTASLVFFIKPVLAPLIAILIMNEAVTLSGWIGIGLILTASFINLKFKH